MNRLITVLTEQRARLVADAALLTALGGAHVYARNSVETIEQIPGVYWSMPIVSEMEETAEPMTVNWDIWAHDWSELVTIATRLKRILHKELPESWNGVYAVSQFRGSTEFPSGKRVGVVRRIMETEVQAVRKRA